MNPSLKFILLPLIFPVLSVILLLALLFSNSQFSISDPLFMFNLFRGLTGFLIGGALALSGMIFQALFRNPLADPYVLGISSGAAAGAAAMFILGAAELLFILVPAGSFAGALMTLGAVLLISGGSKSSTDRLLLSGVITGVILSSLLIYIISISDSKQLAGVTWWILGDLQGGTPFTIVTLVLLSVLSLILVRYFANDLNVLSLGDEEAALLGTDVRKMRLFFVICASLLASSSVAVAGVIGFIGLIVPHGVRLLLGSDQRKISLSVFFAGGCFLQTCDMIAAWLSQTREMPVGVVSSCLGGSVFLYLLARRKER